jgi:hypothetical protein
MGRTHGRSGAHREADPYWAVARFLQGHDRLALAALAFTGYETFMPRMRQLAGMHWRTLPLFSSYLFVRVTKGIWRPIERTMGVAGLVKFDERPARCPDSEIARLLAMGGPDGIVRLPSVRPQHHVRGVSPGARVRITEGPFSWLRSIMR